MVLVGQNPHFVSEWTSSCALSSVCHPIPWRQLFRPFPQTCKSMWQWFIRWSCHVNVFCRCCVILQHQAAGIAPATNIYTQHVFRPSRVNTMRGQNIANVSRCPQVAEDLTSLLTPVLVPSTQCIQPASNPTRPCFPHNLTCANLSSPEKTAAATQKSWIDYTNVGVVARSLANRWNQTHWNHTT